MIRVTVILPDGRKGQVEVDPHASREEVKRTIVSDLKLGKPENFLLAVAGAPESEDTTIGNIQLKDGDLVFILNLQAARGVPVKLDPKSFK
jgi:hypothetical protein